MRARVLFGVALLGALTAGMAIASGDDEPPGLPGWLGIKFRECTPEEGMRLSAAGVNGGGMVSGVAEAGPAASAGVAEGDVIVGVDGDDVKTAADVAKAFGRLRTGKGAMLRVARGDQVLVLEVAPVARDRALRARAVEERAARWLAGQQLEDGSWGAMQTALATPSAPMTALCVRALAGCRPELRDAEPVAGAIERALGYLKSRTTEKGAVLEPDRAMAYKNYATALTLSTLVALGRGERDAAWIASLRDHLIEAQIDEGESFGPADWQFGAWNYYEMDDRSHVRADMSVLAWVVEALLAAGVAPDSPTIKRARRFAFKCQAVRDDVAPETKALLDGGFAFSPRESKAGQEALENDDLVFHSYGSATADGLRTILAAGVPRDDARVKAAVGWFAEHWDLDKNPGFAPDSPIPYADAILFYYYNGLARALTLRGEDLVETAKHGKRRWASDIVGELLYHQHGDGRFQNRETMMGEDNPHLATALALLANAACREALEKAAANKDGD